MNKIIFLFVFTFFTSEIFAQGIEFRHLTWEEALKIAQEEEKIIFVDAYAVWCGPCKRMSKNVFTQTEVGNFYNKNFVNLKLDMEKGEGLKFGKKYPVSAYPTLYYIAPNGKVVQSVRGAQNVERFLSLGKKALSLIDNSEQYAEEYDKGNRDPELVLKYIKALNKAGQNSLKIANEYLRSQKDLTSEGNLKILMESTVQADSYIFDLFTENRTNLEGVFSNEVINQKITSACQNTADKAIEFESRDLLEEAFDKMKKHYPEKADDFVIINEMQYNLAFKDVKAYLKAAKKYAKTTAADNEDQLSKIAIVIVQNFKEDKKAMDFAEECAQKAAEVSGKYDYDLTYAGILLENGKKAEAIEVAERALEKAKEVGLKASSRVELFLKRIKGA
jgi:thiol-disulfide isomerase/thioredoxin